MTRRNLLGLMLVIAAGACYLGIVTIRQGPPSGGDTVPLTSVTSALSSGQLQAAAANDQLPNPPGYALLTSPFVAALPSLVGSPTWCTTPTRAASLHRESAYRHDPTFPTDVAECGVPRRLADGTLGMPQPSWYRAQGLLGAAAWFVLAVGSLALLRVAGAGSLFRQAELLAFLAFLPAASSAIVQLFHPQDIVSLGLALGGLAQTLRHRWVVAGALFGAALLTKQFAILLVIPALAVAPNARSRLRLTLAAAVVFGAGIVPFLVAAPRATLNNLSGFGAGGAVSGSTILTLLGVTGSSASAVARDAPVLFALALCLLAARRRGPWLGTPDALVSMGLACFGSRLVFESVVFPYYLLATSVMFFVSDLVAQRSPHRSLAWCAGAAFFVALRPANAALDAWGTLFFAVVAVGVGVAEVVHLRQERRFAT